MKKDNPLERFVSGVGQKRAPAGGNAVSTAEAHAAAVRKIIETNSGYSMTVGQKIERDSRNDFYLHLVFASGDCARTFALALQARDVTVEEGIVVDGHALAGLLGIDLPDARLLKPAANVRRRSATPR